MSANGKRPLLEFAFFAVCFTENLKAFFDKEKPNAYVSISFNWNVRILSDIFRNLLPCCTHFAGETRMRHIRKGTNGVPPYSPEAACSVCLGKSQRRGFPPEA